MNKEEIEKKINDINECIKNKIYGSVVENNTIDFYHYNKMLITRDFSKYTEDELIKKVEECRDSAYRTNELVESYMDQLDTLLGNN